MKEEDIQRQVLAQYMCRVRRSNYELRERREEETAQARCQSHTAHVAVVDLPPPCLASSLPSIPRFSPPCQDVSGVSRHGVSCPQETALRRPLTICGLLLPLVCLRPNPASTSIFRAYQEKSGTDRVLPLAPDGDDASAHKRDPILMVETVLF